MYQSRKACYQSLDISEFSIHYKTGISLQNGVFVCPHKLHSVHKRWLAY